MKNIKVSIAPPYSSDKADYVSKIDASIEFDDPVEAFAFQVDLIQLIAKFQVEIDKFKKEKSNAVS
jgi:hypothetical protein